MPRRRRFFVPNPIAPEARSGIKLSEVAYALSMQQVRGTVLPTRTSDEQAWLNAQEKYAALFEREALALRDMMWNRPDERINERSPMARLALVVGAYRAYRAAFGGRMAAKNGIAIPDRAAVDYRPPPAPSWKELVVMAGHELPPHPVPNPTYDALKVQIPSVGETGALTRLYDYKERDGDRRLAAEVYWPDSADQLPEYLDAGLLRASKTGKPVTRLRTIKVQRHPPESVAFDEDMALITTPRKPHARPALPAAPTKAVARRPFARRLTARAATKLPAAALAPVPGGNISGVKLEAIQTNKAHQPREGLVLENVDRIVATFEKSPAEFWQLFDPVEVRPLGGGHFELIHGHHRFEAAQRIRRHEREVGHADPFPNGIPAKVLHVTPERARQIADAANLRGQPMTPGEIAPLLKRWIDEGSTPAEIMAEMPGLKQNGVKKGDIPLYAAVAGLPKAMVEGLDNPALRNRYTLAHAMEFARAKGAYHMRSDELESLWRKLFITDAKEVTPASLRKSLEFVGGAAGQQAEAGQQVDMFGNTTNSSFLTAFSDLTATQAELEHQRRQLANFRGAVGRTQLKGLGGGKREELVAEAETEIKDLERQSADLKRKLWGGIAANPRRLLNPIPGLGADAERVLHWLSAPNEEWTAHMERARGNFFIGLGSGMLVRKGYASKHLYQAGQRDQNGHYASGGVPYYRLTAAGKGLWRMVHGVRGAVDWDAARRVGESLPPGGVLNNPYPTAIERGNWRERGFTTNDEIQRYVDWLAAMDRVKHFRSREVEARLPLGGFPRGSFAEDLAQTTADADALFMPGFDEGRMERPKPQRERAKSSSKWSPEAERIAAGLNIPAPTASGQYAMFNPRNRRKGYAVDMDAVRGTALSDNPAGPVRILQTPTGDPIARIQLLSDRGRGMGTYEVVQWLNGGRSQIPGGQDITWRQWFESRVSPRLIYRDGSVAREGAPYGYLQLMPTDEKFLAPQAQMLNPAAAPGWGRSWSYEQGGWAVEGLAPERMWAGDEWEPTGGAFEDKADAEANLKYWQRELRKPGAHYYRKYRMVKLPDPQSPRLFNPRAKRPTLGPVQMGFDVGGNVGPVQQSWDEFAAVPTREKAAHEEPAGPAPLDYEFRMLTPEEEMAVNKGKMVPYSGQARFVNPAAVEVRKSTSSFGRWVVRTGPADMRFFWRKADALSYAAAVNAAGGLVEHSDSANPVREACPGCRTMIRVPRHRNPFDCPQCGALLANR